MHIVNISFHRWDHSDITFHLTLDPMLCGHPFGAALLATCALEDLRSVLPPESEVWAWPAAQMSGDAGSPWHLTQPGWAAGIFLGFLQSPEGTSPLPGSSPLGWGRGESLSPRRCPEQA